MSEPKFHHYVPRFYLARFVDANGALWVYDKSEDRVFSTGPEGIAGENKFYEVRELTDLGLSPLLMETQFADLESQVSAITECWLNQVETGTTVEIPTVNREIISLFIALQILRTAEMRTQIVQFHEAVQRLQGREPVVHPDDPNYLHTRVLWNDDLVKAMAKRIGECIWVFARNDSTAGFYTSDHPVLIKSSDSKQWVLGPKVFEPGMYIVFPLTPIWMLYCHAPNHWGKLSKFDGTVSPVQFTEDMVNHENSGQVGMSQRFVFSDRPDFEFARMFCELEQQIKDPKRERYGAV